MLSLIMRLKVSAIAASFYTKQPYHVKQKSRRTSFLYFGDVKMCTANVLAGSGATTHVSKTWLKTFGSRYAKLHFSGFLLFPMLSLL